MGPLKKGRGNVSMFRCLFWDREKDFCNQEVFQDQRLGKLSLHGTAKMVRQDLKKSSSTKFDPQENWKKSVPM